MNFWEKYLTENQQFSSVQLAMQVFQKIIFNHATKCQQKADEKEETTTFQQKKQKRLVKNKTSDSLSDILELQKQQSYESSKEEKKQEKHVKGKSDSKQKKKRKIALFTDSSDGEIEIRGDEMVIETRRTTRNQNKKYNDQSEVNSKNQDNSEEEFYNQESDFESKEKPMKKRKLVKNNF